MKQDKFDRRTFLKSAVAGTAVAATTALPQTADAQQVTPAPASASQAAAYSYLNLEEQAFK